MFDVQIVGRKIGGAEEKMQFNADGAGGPNGG